MRRSIKLHQKRLLLAILVAILIVLLPPVRPVYAVQTHTWDTKADFDAGGLHQVDTSYSLNDVVLGINLYTGTGADGELNVPDGLFFINGIRSAVSSTSYAYRDWVYVSSTTGFAAGQEVLIIQMTGEGAGNWETNFVDGVTAFALVLAKGLKNTYHVDGNSKAQVVKIPHYTNVTVNPGGILTCHFWNQFGDWTGGILFFRATGTVTVNAGSLIDVVGRGFHGGSRGSGGGRGGDGKAQNKKWRNGQIQPGGGEGGEGGGSLYCGHSNSGGDGWNGSVGGSGGKGDGPGGGDANQGGTNNSSNDLNSMQLGGGGGGGDGGHGGHGAGGGGGGGCVTDDGKDGHDGGRGGNGGAGGMGGTGGGIAVIYAKSINIMNGALLAKGASGSSIDGLPGGNAGNGGDGGKGAGEGYLILCGFVGGGGGGGGGNGGVGGDGGNAGSGGPGGTVWLAADSLNISSNVDANGVGGGNGGARGHGGSGGDGARGGHGISSGKHGKDGHSGSSGSAGSSGLGGGSGEIRLDYRTLSGSTSPAPSFTSGLYYAAGTIASDVWDTGTSGETWRTLSWAETLHANTDVSFEVRASDTLFTKDNNTIPWISAGSTSPVTSGLPSGRVICNGGPP